MNRMFHIFKSIFPALAMAFFLNACAAAVNWDYPRMPSKAFAHPETTSVGALFQEAADKHPGLSGFSVVEHGENAFLARLAMADLAEKTLDAQYYIWDSDTTGRILASRLMRAANRGVRVRILIDDHYQTERERLCGCGAGWPPQHRNTFLQPGNQPVLAHDEFFGRFCPR